MKKYILYISAVFILSACSNTTAITEYHSRQPKMVAETFFNGHLIASGIVKNRSGKVTRSFVADITAYWEGGLGTLDEAFIFDNGEHQRRVWTLSPQPPKGDGVQRYIGTAGDVIGEAPIEVAGNAMFLKYRLLIPYKDSELALTVDDKMYLVSEDTLINESVLYKYGLRVGSITLTIIKSPSVH